jgi:hypothetical protein
MGDRISALPEGVMTQSETERIFEKLQSAERAAGEAWLSKHPTRTPSTSSKPSGQGLRRLRKAAGTKGVMR